MIEVEELNGLCLVISGEFEPLLELFFSTDSNREVRSIP